MSFIPAFFSKFGKTSNDVLTQKFDVNREDFNNQASIKTQANGFTVTSTAVQAPENKLTGKVNVKYDDKSFGETSVEYTTQGKVKGTLKLSKLQRGLVLNTEAELAKGQLSGKATAEYAQDSFAGSLEYASKKNAVLTSAVYGFDGISVGGAVVADINALTSGGDIKKALLPDFGVQYEDGNMISTLTYESNKTISASLFHRVNNELQLASKFSTHEKGNTLSLGAQYKLNASTVIKGRTTILSDQNYAVYGYIQHRLANPNLTVGVSSSWDNVKNTQFGVNLAFGDN